MRGERDTRREAEREREGGSDYLQNASVCTFKTPPCVPSKRPCPVWHWRFESTHGSVLNAHTEAFWSARQEETHSQPHSHIHKNYNHNNTHCPTTTHNTHNNRQHTVHWEEGGERWNKRKRHVKREPDEKRERQRDMWRKRCTSVITVILCGLFVFWN